MKSSTFLLTLLLTSNLLFSYGNYSLYDPDDNKITGPQLTQPKCYAEIIDTAFFTTLQDCDGDGYPNWRWLVIDMKGEAPSGKAFFEVWLNSGEKYYLLASTDIVTFPRSRYSFQVDGQLHLEGNVAIIVKDTGLEEDVEYYHMKNKIKIESADNDLKAEVAYCEWALFDFIDADGDGYASQHRLNININTCPVPYQVYFKASACMLPATEEPCWYYTSPVYTTDQTGEILHMVFGGINGGLSHGEYRVGLQVFNALTDEPLSRIYTCSEDMKFELPEEDELPPVDFSLENVYLGDEQIDLDKDEYSRSRDLNFDANVSSGIFNLTAKILYKQIDEDEFHDYYTTPQFTVTGSEEEYQKVMIGGDNPELDHNIYDFKIQLFLGTSLVAEKLPEDENDLKDQWFETAMEDEPFKMRTAFWSLVNDWDGDSYASFRKLTVEFDIITDPEPVYFKLTSWLGENETTIYMSEGFKPSASDPIIVFDIPGEQYFYGTGTVYLFRASNNELINVVHGLDTRFERPEEDMVYSVSSVEWVESVDFDLDGFFSYRKLDMDIQAAPLERTLKLEVSMCKEPVSTSPCPYLTDIYFKADSTTDDIISVEFGLPNAELDSGIYHCTISLIDSVTGEVVIDQYVIDNNLHMESSNSDPYKFMITDVYYEDEVDMDGDLFNAVSNLYFNVDVTGGVHSLYATLFYRPDGETEYIEYYTTGSFDVTTGNNAYEMITIGFPNDQLDHGVYDLKLNVFNADNNEQLAELGPEERNFSDQQYETLEEDTPPLGNQAITSMENETVRYDHLSVYPNPFDSYLSVITKTNENKGSVIIRLIDLRGALVTERKIENTSMDSNNLHLNNLEDLQPGIYLLEIQSPGRIGQLLVVKR